MVQQSHQLRLEAGLQRRSSFQVSGERKDLFQKDKRVQKAADKKVTQ
jgi:hypothetical protein